MAITLLANIKANPGSTGGTTGSINTTGATLLIVCISEYTGATGFTVSDSKGNTWNGLTQKSNAPSGAQSRIYYSVPSSVGSGHTFTYSGSGGYPLITVMAFSGTHATTPFDQQNGATGSSVTSLAPGSVTPSENNEVIVTSMCLDNTASALPSIGSSFSITDSNQEVGGTSQYGGSAYLVQTSLAAVNPSWSWNNSGGPAATIATFKSDGSGGGGTVVPAFDGEMLVGGLLEMSGGL